MNVFSQIFGLCGCSMQLPKQHETSHPESKKMEADPKNVAEAFPHTDFSSQVCAEVFPLDS